MFTLKSKNITTEPNCGWCYLAKEMMFFSAITVYPHIVGFILGSKKKNGLLFQTITNLTTQSCILKSAVLILIHSTLASPEQIFAFLYCSSGFMWMHCPQSGLCSRGQNIGTQLSSSISAGIQQRLIPQIVKEYSSSQTMKSFSDLL